MSIVRARAKLTRPRAYFGGRGDGGNVYTRHGIVEVAVNLGGDYPNDTAWTALCLVIGGYVHTWGDERSYSRQEIVALAVEFANDVAAKGTPA